ncbi:MAG TPA: ATP-binding protein, partial [Adhaeribacter sp.]|nr:ATP-binding protein [Adhaeribacter sp.]
KRDKLQLELEEKAKILEQRVAIFSNVAEKISGGDYTSRIDEKDKGELSNLADALNKMASDLGASFTKLEKQAWLQQGELTLNNQLQGEKQPAELASDVLTEVVKYLKASVGVLYLADEHHDFLQPVSAYACKTDSKQRIPFGEGLVGQVARDKTPLILKDVPGKQFRVTSGLIDGTPATVIIYPFLYNNLVQGVLELGLVQEMPELAPEYLAMVAANASIAFNTAVNRQKLQELLQETQTQGEELQVQQDELQRSNAELEMQSQKLQASEEELRVQQEELLQSNQDLEEKAQLLEEKNQFIEQKSRELFQLNDDVETKNTELELASRYKSEFLANMSHELRTPLNSILLLAKLLSESKDLDLGDDRYEYAKVIHNSGLGLLELINEILDLSKIEAGQMQITVEDVPFSEIKTGMQQMFSPLANEKSLELKLEFSEELPTFMQTDKQRLEQILKNLLSNAIKFTEKGTVSLTVAPFTGNAGILANSHLQHVPVIAFTVTDSGIGIPEDKLNLVFDAFKQVDGSSRRKQGGTGLGLSISREISRLLGGEIHLESTAGKGSTFTVYVPQTMVPVPENETP